MKKNKTIYQNSIMQIKSILEEILKNEKVTVILFGSRGRGNNSKTSDIDLGIVAKSKVSNEKLTLLREKFENSNIPYKIDLVDVLQTSEELKENIKRDGKVIWKN